MFNTNAGGVAIAGPVTNNGISVSNGLFTVAIDFGPGVFTGATNWLQIGVETNGGSSFTALTPRQQLYPTPYALYASNAANATTAGSVSSNAVSGSGIQNATITSNKFAAGQVVKTLNGLTDNVSLAAGTNITLTANGNSLQISSTGGTGGVSTNYVAKAGDTMTGSLNLNAPAGINFGGNTRQMLNLYNLAYGIGVQNFTFYQRTAINGTFAWYAGGTHSDAPNDPGTNGVSLMNLDSYGDLTLSGAVTAGQIYGTSSGGSFGSGISGSDTGNFNNATGVNGSSTIGDGVYGSGGNKGVYGITSSAGPTHAGVFGENSAVGGTAVVGNALAINSAGIAGVADTAGSSGVYGRGNLWAGFFQGNVNITGTNAFGGTTRQMISLYDDGTYRYGIGVQSSTLYQRAGTGGGFAWYSGGSHNGNQNNSGGGFTCMTLDGTGHLSVSGLTITGGSDVAEPFEMSTAEIPKGSVVSIDEEHPGHLKVCVGQYDTRVAGIISGANGINPGLSLHQTGVMEGSQNVALSGRVYVLADAANGSIKPGDLLTTSKTPGHAMKVTNHARAQGAVIGKAMSSLKTGKGLVLVLVTLE